MRFKSRLNSMSPSKFLIWIYSAIILTTLSGCTTVGPDYNPPQVEISTDWNTSPDPALLPREDLVRQWWTLFEDPLLNRLIETASRNNLDLLTAIARVEETQARLGIAAGAQYPDANVTADIDRRRTSENSAGSGQEETFYTPGIGASWEIDLFGRIRRSVEAATAQYQASKEDRTDVLISLYAYVSLTYLEIRTTQARLDAARANISSQK